MDLIPTPFPSGLFSGTRAITSQSYTEANVKNGLQFELSMYNATLAASGNLDILITTGSLPLIIKAKEVSFSGAGVTSSLYEGGVYSAGSAISIYNFNRINPSTSTITAVSSPTITTLGTQVSSPGVSIGSTGQGSITFGSYGTTGTERILLPNTKYLARTTNNDSSVAKVFV